MTLDEMPCQEVVEVITEYLEGSMPPHDRARFDAHLAACAPCRLYLRQMRDTIQATGALRQEQMTADHRRQVAELFRGWRAEG